MIGIGEQNSGETAGIDFGMKKVEEGHATGQRTETDGIEMITGKIEVGAGGEICVNLV